MSDSLVSTPLQQWELLREFKIRMLRPGGENLSPFAERVATYREDTKDVDVSEIHASVRQSILDQIHAVQQQRRSQIVLLAGRAGAGKTHLLRYFARPEIAEENQYIFVSGSNSWKIDEFLPCVLDWIITALTHREHTTQDHLLLKRIRAIGFRAIDQLLTNKRTLHQCCAKRSRFRWLFGTRLATHDTIQQLTQARDPKVFNYLDFNTFADEVAVRFLADSSNPVQRYALRVLLSYIFPDRTLTGLGVHERVIHWFRRRPDDGYWLRRFGVDENLDRRFTIADAIKLLLHLFSPELSAQLSTERERHEPRLFLLVFDQAEGRNELFNNIEDWNRFFAYLSELYNSLPNLLIIFTMTLHLRQELHNRMERQFRDRIRQDERFVLLQPEPEQIRALYRARLRHWLADDSEIQSRYTQLPVTEQYLPFDAEAVVQIAGTASIREILENLDRAFKERLRELVIEPNYDFQFICSEETQKAQNQSTWDYTADHITTIRQLFQGLQNELENVYGLRLSDMEEEPELTNALRLTFEPINDSSGRWVRVFLSRIGRRYNEALNTVDGLLRGKHLDRNFAWILRPMAIESDRLPRPEQMFIRLLSTETEIRLRAINHLLQKRSDYLAQGNWAEAWRIIQREIEGLYINEMLKDIATRMQGKPYHESDLNNVATQTAQ
ncbi:MAG: hypothetical protein RMJ56_00120 [Gemmataceae bacterium]|nr:hypothetical protein [Gemmata sp.]MDW8195985.1 hypothetical protein [Gemmataceae bacterium]